MTPLQGVPLAGRCGERTERCQRQKKRSERVAAVKILSVRRKAAQKFWTPQQDPVIPQHKGRGERIATASVRTGFAMTYYTRSAVVIGGGVRARRPAERLQEVRQSGRTEASAPTKMCCRGGAKPLPYTLLVTQYRKKRNARRRFFLYVRMCLTCWPEPCRPRPFRRRYRHASWTPQP